MTIIIFLSIGVGCVLHWAVNEFIIKKNKFTIIEKYRRKKKAQNLLALRDTKIQKDDITNMQSNDSFGRNIRKIIKQAHAQNGVFGLLSLNVNSFHLINQSFGYSNGNDVIAEISQRLTRVMEVGVYGSERQLNQSITRLSGNTFAIIVPVLLDENEVESMAKKCMSEIGKPMNVDNQEICLSLSIGCSIYPFDAVIGEDLIRNTEIALQQAKKLGDNQIVRYDELATDDIEQSCELIKNIRAGIKNNEFEVYFQPIFHLDKIAGAEALLRWNKNDVGISPSRFIPVAEHHGLMDTLGEVVVKASCVSAKKWIDAGLVENSFKVSVNISVKQLEHGHCFSMIKKQLIESGLSPNNFQIEISENTFVDKAVIGKQLDKISAYGISVIYDDFGLGQANIAHLKNKNITGFKIDRSFIKNENNNQLSDNVKMIEMFVSIAKALGLDLIAEGVGDEHQEELVLDLGIEYTQGFLKSKPLTQDSFSLFCVKTKKETANKTTSELMTRAS